MRNFLLVSAAVIAAFVAAYVLRKSPPESSADRGLEVVARPGAAARLATSSVPSSTQPSPVAETGGGGCPARKKERANERIIGGDDANIKNWPGFVVLRTSRQPGSNDLYYFCGGTLISPSWVVTAAHCIKSGGTHKIEKVGGAYVQRGLTENFNNRLEIIEAPNNLVEPLETRVHLPDNIIVHDGYHGVGGGNDIALIHLATPAAGAIMRFSAASAADPEANGTHVWVAGFGVTVNGAVDWRQTSDGRRAVSGSQVLKEVELPEYERASCAKRIDFLKSSTPKASGLPADAKITEGQICAGLSAATEHPKDSCHGNSGGPLVRTGADGCPILVGLVSYGPDPCGEADKPGIYTRVSAYAGWIRDHINGALIKTVSTSGDMVRTETVNEALDAMRSLTVGPTPRPAGVEVELVPQGDVHVDDFRQVKVTTKVTGFLIVLDIDADGKITYLLPNAFEPEVPHLAAGESRSFGGPSDAFQFKAVAPFGLGHVVAVVSPDKSLAERLRLESRAQEVKGARGLVVVENSRPADDLLNLTDQVLRGSAQGGNWAYGEAPYTIVK